MWRLLTEARHFPRSFQLLTASQSVSVFGTLLVWMGFDLFVLHKTGSALQFSLMLAVQLVGPILFRPWSILCYSQWSPTCDNKIARNSSISVITARG